MIYFKFMNNSYLLLLATLFDGVTGFASVRQEHATRGHQADTAFLREESLLSVAFYFVN